MRLCIPARRHAVMRGLLCPVLTNPPDQSIGRTFTDDILVAVSEASASGIRALVV
ncbi:hypothetical protein ACWC6I_43410 [Streptomyces sp. NPDC001414]